MGVLSHLEPQSIFYYFEQISNIPHGSGNEKAVSDFVVNFAKNKGFYCRQDEALNVVIKKPATRGYENSKPVILQGHLDMVCEKNAQTKHDFLIDPLDLYIDGDFIMARGTTLGADNGIAVALMLALLDSENLQHPPIEALFTTDEEVGMGGAKAFVPLDLEGKMLINLDSEEEGHFVVSCSGGQRVELSLPTIRENAPDWGSGYVINITGLQGGHSGSDIHLQRANANILMGRVLSRVMEVFESRLVSISGGQADNAIAREASAEIMLRSEDFADVTNFLTEIKSTLCNEYKYSDSGLELTISRLQEEIQMVLTEETASSARRILQLIPCGVQTVSLSMNNLIESSSNLGVVRTSEESIDFYNATRSSIVSRRELILDKMRALASLTGAKCKPSKEYPGWEFNPESPLLKLFKEVYISMYAKEPKVTAIHAGLECGLFGEKIPGLDMISAGPEMSGVHTPDEKLSISSTIRTWDFLTEVLSRIKD